MSGRNEKASAGKSTQSRSGGGDSGGGGGGGGCGGGDRSIAGVGFDVGCNVFLDNEKVLPLDGKLLVI